MHYIIQETPFNLRVVMIKVMQEVATRTKHALPYGMFLTLVFQECKVNLESEISKKLQYYNTYNVQSSKRMAYIKINEHQTHKYRDIDDEDRDRDEIVEQPHLKSEPVQREQAPSTLVAQTKGTPVQRIMLDDDQMNELKEHINNQVQELEHRVHGRLMSSMEVLLRQILAQHGLINLTSESHNRDPPSFFDLAPPFLD